MLKTIEDLGLTPIEKELSRSFDFVRNLAIAAAFKLVLERLQEAETAIALWESDEELAADNAPIIPIVKKEIEDIEKAIVEFAELNLAMGISA
jgi:hypothetical protein